MILAQIIKLGGHDVQGFSKVEFNEAEWEFDYFFLHFRLKKPLVEVTYFVRRKTNLFHVGST
tara:strand:- start:1844 stop:2029 length:186 start_codon:yes stop_codon:yes gene_type:complete